MNRAIFLYTLLIKMRSLPVLFTILFFCVIIPVGISHISGTLGNEAVAPLFIVVGENASIPLVIAFVLQKDAFADTRNLSDGEYLSLLFTRPITRAEYVVSKWLAAAFCVTLALLLQMVVFHICQSIAGRADDYVWNRYRACDIVLQSLSVAAVVSVINAIPRRLGVWIFMCLSYSALVAQTPIGEFTHSAGVRAGVGSHAMQVYAAVINNLLSNKISSFDLFNSSHVDWGLLISFFSNLTLYLLFAVWLLNKREFFYASE